MDDETFAWCLFCEADADGSGGLDRDEVKTLARQLGYPLSAVELDEAMAEMDTDGGGTVEFDEFLAWFRRIQDAGGGKTSWAKQLAVGTTRAAQLR
jgi:Ca2+-binding EF-hand superfamily protein